MHNWGEFTVYCTHPRYLVPVFVTEKLSLSMNNFIPTVSTCPHRWHMRYIPRFGFIQASCTLKAHIKGSAQDCSNSRALAAMFWMKDHFVVCYMCVLHVLKGRRYPISLYIFRVYFYAQTRYSYRPLFNTYIELYYLYLKNTWKMIQSLEMTRIKKINIRTLCAGRIHRLAQ